MSLFPGTSLSRRLSRNASGFSLVELLAVVAVMGILAGISSVALSGNASRISTASVQCANLFQSAREAAILRKNPVAVAIFPATSQTPAALTAFEFQPASQSWSRISKWEKLPTGVVPDPTLNIVGNSALSQNSPVVSPALPVVDFAGTSLAPGGSGGYAYLVFLPSGALLQQNSRPGWLRLAEGTFDNQLIQRTGSAANFADLIVNPATGQLKIVRPN